MREIAIKKIEELLVGLGDVNIISKYPLTLELSNSYQITTSNMGIIANINTIIEKEINYILIEHNQPNIYGSFRKDIFTYSENK